MKRQIQIVILCGGPGTRLGEYTQKCPKSLLPVQERPFLDYIISHFIQAGYRHFHLLCHHHYEQFVSYQNRMLQFQHLGVRVELHREPMLAGTAGALSLFLPDLDPSVDAIICCNGDSLSDISIEHFVNNCNDEIITIALTDQKDRHQRFGKVCRNELGLVTAFLEKQATDSNFINAGLYYIPKKCFGYFKSAPLSMENQLFPILIEKEKLMTYHQPNTQFFDMGIVEELNRLQTINLKDRLKF